MGGSNSISIENDSKSSSTLIPNSVENFDDTENSERRINPELLRGNVELVVSASTIIHESVVAGDSQNYIQNDSANHQGNDTVNPPIANVIREENSNSSEGDRGGITEDNLTEDQFEEGIFVKSQNTICNNLVKLNVGRKKGRPRSRPKDYYNPFDLRLGIKKWGISAKYKGSKKKQSKTLEENSVLGLPEEAEKIVDTAMALGLHLPKGK